MPRVPLSEMPPKPKSWWKTVPGQLAQVAILIGLIVIMFGACGFIGPTSL